MSVVEQISALIRLHSSLAGPLSFAVTLVACLPGTNLVVPAGPVITAMGVLAGAGAISWTLGAVLGGAIPGTLIAPESRWLPIGMVLVPATTIAISAAAMLLRSREARRRLLQPWRAGVGAPCEER